MLSTRIAVMHDGRLVQMGTPQDVYERPTDTFVADFLGGANFLPGEIRGIHAAAGAADGTIVVALDGGSVLRAGAARNRGFAAGEKVVVCLRPEALELAEAASPAGTTPRDNILAGTLRLKNYLGSVMSCEVELAGGQRVRVQTTNPRAHARFPEGGAVTIRFSPDDVLLLKQTS